jgi:pyruvate/2-oxoglutarate dehydrogenase complex dihydrolipoamide dehydrogenase (E3) component
MTINHDALIIGAGQAGPPLVGRLAAAGMSVGLI